MLAVAQVEYNEAKDYAKANMHKSRYTIFFIYLGNNIQDLLQETVSRFCYNKQFNIQISPSLEKLNTYRAVCWAAGEKGGLLLGL